ncbi:MAG: TRAP transporter substrate-binding protein DctP, partial [Pseudomonadales bacterium]|nr:TRAP transporter substrate-binding protein DctP [Pseudomonadales bacterium]
FPAGNSGVQMAGWFNKEIHSLEDLRGLKMRIPGLGGEVMRRAGASPVNLPGGEIYTSLQTGVVDASEWVGPYNDLAFALHEVAEFYHYPGWHEPGAVLEAIVNRDAFEALPEDLQAIVDVAWRAVNQDVLDEFTARNHKALQTLTERHGTKLRRLPKAVLDQLREISAEVVREAISPNDDLGQRILKSYTDFQSSVQEYHDVSEAAYLRVRQSE